MRWPTNDELWALVPLPEGYCFERLVRAHIAPLIAAIKVWHPDISVGANSGYLREDYFLKRVFFGRRVRAAHRGCPDHV